MNDSTLKLILQAIDKASGPLGDVSKGLDGVDKKTGFLGKAFGTLQSVAVGALVGITAAATTLGAGIGTLGISTAAQLETSEVGFRTLLGSAEKAGAIMEKIKTEAARTPFELPGLTASTQLLTSITKDADKSLKVILDVGEALAAMGKGQPELDRIIINLQQIGAVGKASMVDIKQFAYNGIPIFELLQKETGLAGEALDKFIGDGKVTFDLLVQMFDKANDSGGMFFEAYINQAGTFNQLLSNSKDAIGILAADIVKQTGIFDLAKKVLSRFTNAISDNKEEIIQFIQNGIKVLGVAFAFLRDQVLPQVLSKLREFGTWWQGEGGESIRKFISEAWGKLTTVIQYFSENVLPPLISFWNSRVIPAFQNIWSLIVTQLWPAFMQLAQAVWDFWAVAGPILVPILMTVGAILAGEVYFAILGVIQVLTWMAQAWTWIFNTVTWVIDGIIYWVNFFKAVFEGVMAFINADANTKAYMIGRLFGMAARFVIDRFTEAKDWIINKFNEIKSSAEQLPGQFSNWFSQIKNDITNRIGEAKDNVVNKFNELRNVNLADVGAQIIQGLINGVRGKAEELRNTVSSLANSIKQGFQSALQIQSPSRWAMWAMDMVGAGLINQAEKLTPQIEMASTDMADSIMSPFKPQTQGQTNITNNTSKPTNNITFAPVISGNLNPEELFAMFESWLAEKNLLTSLTGT